MFQQNKAVALQQAEYVHQIQKKNESLAKASERERSLARVMDKIRQTFDLNVIFKNTTQEVRQLLRAERVCVYKFRNIPNIFNYGR